MKQSANVEEWLCFGRCGITADPEEGVRQRPPECRSISGAWKWGKYVVVYRGQGNGVNSLLRSLSSLFASTAMESDKIMAS